MKRTITCVAAAAGLVGWGITRRHRRLVDVAPELRSPVLYVPMSLSETSLAIGRRLTAAAPAGALADGVEPAARQLPADVDGYSVTVFVYERNDRPRPTGALLWMHGGGLVMGTPAQAHELCSRFAAELGIVVVSVDYRLAPELPFPAGLDDCMSALRWMHDHGDELGIDTTRIAVGGDSAGGGLAAAVAQRSLDDGDLPVCFQLLQYPMLDDRTAARSGTDAVVWTNASNRFAWQAYLGHSIESGEQRPYAVPARRSELGGLAPAWIGVGSIDLFHDECRDYADRLRLAGVDCHLTVVPGMYHAADRLAPKAASMQAFVAEMVAALSAALTTN